MAARKRTARRAGAGRENAKVTKSVGSLKSWSYSTWKTYDDCPKRIYYSKIEKVSEPESDALVRGSRTHKVGENYIKGLIDEFPERGPGKQYAHFQEDMDAFRESATAQAEADYAFTKAWKKTKWDDWNNAWVRAKVDVQEQTSPSEMLIVDFKTGQMRNYEKQGELYGLMGLKAKPRVKKVLFEIWYLDHPYDDMAITGMEFHRKEEAALQSTWEKRVTPMLADTEFKLRTGTHCGWCPFKVSKGGPCPKG